MNRVVGPVRLTPEDYVAESFALAKEMYGTRVRLNLVVAIFAFAFGGLVLSGGKQVDQLFGVVLIVLGALALGIFLYWPFATRAQFSKIANDPLNRSFFLDITYEFRDDGFESRSAGGTTSYTPWNCVVRAKRSPNALILYISQLHFFFLPLSQIDEEVLVFMTEKLKLNGLVI